MSILFPESVLSNRERFIRELLHQGHECATKLKFLLQKPIASSSEDDDGSTFSSSSAEELLSNVLRSFTDTISVLTSSNSCDDNVEAAAADDEVVGADSCNDLRSEDSSESNKKRSLTSSNPTTTKDRRGSYKRRRTEQTWTTVSQTIEDNYAWRKYGQKEILNSKFPRGYFRCSRKHEQGCRAIKQVQRMEENPDMYLTTYIGFHTCKDNLKAPQMVTFSDTNNWDSFLVMNSNSDSKVPNENDAPISSSQTSIIKQEYPKEDTSASDLTDNLDPALWSDLKDFELSKPGDNADASVYSCTDSQSLDMDFGAFSSHFSTAGFHFDESHLL